MFSGMLAEQWWIDNFVPMEYIPATVNLTVYDSGQITINKDGFQKFVDDVEAGNIKLSISRTFSIDQIIEAHQLMDSNVSAGKIVVVV